MMKFGQSWAKVKTTVEIRLQEKFAINLIFAFNENLQSLWNLPSMKIYNQFEICIQWKFAITLKFAINENLQSLCNKLSMPKLKLLASNSVKVAQILLKVIYSPSADQFSKSILNSNLSQACCRYFNLMQNICSS